MAIRHPVGQRPTMTPGQEAEEAKMSGPENYTAWYSQEKKLWVNIAVIQVLRMSSSPCLGFSHTLQKF